MNRRQCLAKLFGIGAGAAAGLGLIWYLQKRPAQISTAPRLEMELETYSTPISETVEKSLESVDSLRRVLSGNSSLADSDAEKALLDNVVSLYAHFPMATGRKFKDASGLRLTTDGWIATAYHFVEDCRKEWRKMAEENLDLSTKAAFLEFVRKQVMNYGVRTRDNKTYAIDPNVWAGVPDLDIAIIKAITPDNQEVLPFRILNRDLQKGDFIRALAMLGEEFQMSSGKVLIPTVQAQAFDTRTGQSRVFYDTFHTDIQGQQGYSGGVFATARSELAGMINYSTLDGRLGGAKIYSVAHLAKELSSEIMRRVREEGN